MKSFLLLAMWATCVSTTVAAETARQIENRFLAPCCFRENLAVHRSPAAIEMRAEIAKLVAAGRTEPEIVEYFVGLHGEKVLREPRGLPFFWLRLIPIALVGLAGLGVIQYIARQHRYRRALAGPVYPVSEEDLEW